jgi:dTDP-4-amino-4,6-dideoxygalactose transaminase
LERKLEVASLDGCLPKVLVPVHLCGQPCDMKRIRELCNKYNVKIVEDASHAIGGSYQGIPIGNCKYSDITVFSFHPVKIVTTAEGGAALTNDHELAEKMALYRSHGITRDQNMMTEPSHGSWYYQQIELGYNYRMTDVQAALGVSQMRRLSEFVSKRHHIARRYDRLLNGLPVEIPYQLDDTYSGLHLYVIRLKLDEIDQSHKQVFEGLREKGIGVNVHYIPVHLQPYYAAMGFQQGDFPESEEYYSEAISLPMYPNLSEEDQDRLVGVLSSLLVSK